MITVSNQTKASHTLTLESADGGTIREQVGPINPLDTATLQRTLTQGTYTVSAGSEAAVPKEIEPATLDDRARTGSPARASFCCRSRNSWASPRVTCVMALRLIALALLAFVAVPAAPAAADQTAAQNSSASAC